MTTDFDDSNFHNNIPFDISINDLLRSNYLNGKLIEDKYGLIPVTHVDTLFQISNAFSEPYNTGGRIEIWMSGHFGFVLTYEDNPSAIVTFDVQDEKPVIFDLMGIIPFKVEKREVIKTGKSRGLSTINWRSFLVDYMETFSIICGFDTMRIGTGLNVIERVIENYRGSYFDESQIQPLTIGRAIQTYDEIALNHEYDLVHSETELPLWSPLFEAKLRIWRNYKYEPLTFIEDPFHQGEYSIKLWKPRFLRPYPKEYVWQKKIN